MDKDSLSPNYGAYLRLSTLLSAQAPPDFATLRADDDPGHRTRPLAHHDELLFIVVHQVFELWFKLVLHELGLARDLLGRQQPGGRDHVPEQDVPRIWSAVNRVNEILGVAAQGFQIMETMSPTNFLEFRDLLIPASGFQSVQFRELEILAGLPESLRMDFEGVAYESKLSEEERTVLERRRQEMTLKDALFDWLSRTPIDRVFPGFAQQFLHAFQTYLGEQIVHQERNPNLHPSQKRAATVRFEQQAEEARRYLLGGDDAQNRAHQAFLFMASYRSEPLLRWPSALVDAFIAFEQSFRIFRFRHARMVERMIGHRTGSGGSPGVMYLDRTTDRYRIFGDLLEARNFLLATSRVPPLPDPSLLHFRFEPGSGM
jgi:tryptophan 2,3-dioxygenase